MTLKEINLLLRESESGNASSDTTKEIVMDQQSCDLKILLCLIYYRDKIRLSYLILYLPKKTSQHLSLPKVVPLSPSDIISKDKKNP